MNFSCIVVIHNNELEIMKIIFQFIELSLLSKTLVVKIKCSVHNKESSCEGPFSGYPSPLAHPHYNLWVPCPLRHRPIAIEKLPSLSPRICMERHSLYYQSLILGGGRSYKGIAINFSCQATEIKKGLIQSLALIASMVYKMCFHFKWIWFQR